MFSTTHQSWTIPSGYPSPAPTTSRDASFTINELDPKYAPVSNVKPVPAFPGDGSYPVWNLLVDVIQVDGVSIPLVSVVPNAPSGVFAAMMNTGTPRASFPPDILYALYSQIPGASVGLIDGEMQFSVPCNTIAIVRVIIGQSITCYIIRPEVLLMAHISGVPYLIHPLDLSQIGSNPYADKDGNNFTVCCLTFLPITANAGWDALFGDYIRHKFTLCQFLPSPLLHPSSLNLLASFDFGSAVAKSPSPAASMQSPSQTDPERAIMEVQNVRMAWLAYPEYQGTVPGFVLGLPGSVPPTDTSGTTASDGALRTSAAIGDAAA
jgi:hypothetical protein